MAADPTSFAALGDGFARDRARLWHRGSEVPGIAAGEVHVLRGDYAIAGAQLVHRTRVFAGHAASFEVLGVVERRSLARDREHLFSNGVIATGPDPGSFELLGAGIAADRSGLWRAKPDGNRAPQLARLDADRASLRILDAEHACDRERVFRRGTPIAGADAGTFAVLRAGHARDAARVYRDGRALAIAPADFVLVDEWHAIVRGQLCFLDEPIAGADPATWLALGNRFGKDAHAVYFDGDVIAAADPRTFIAVTHAEGCGWARDAQRVWFRIHEWHDHADGERLYEVKIDAATFVAIDDVFARAGDDVIRGNHLVDDADPRTFRPLGDGWYSDDESVWFGASRIAGADAATLAVHGEYAVVELAEPELVALGDGYAAAATGVLFAGSTLVGPAPDQARSLGGGYLVDAHAAWFFELATESRKLPSFEPTGARLDGVDPATLRRAGAFAIATGAVFAGTARLTADPATFRALDAHHGSDGRIAYFGAQRIDADPAKLRVLGGVFAARGYTLATFFDVIEDAWATDGTTLFVCGRPAWDRSTRYLDDDDVGKLQRLDLASLRVLDPWVASDGRVTLDLRRGVVDTTRDLATLEVLGEGYARDRSCVWSSNGELNARPADFRVLGDGYATDGVGCWYRGRPITPAHPDLLSLGGGWARDTDGILCAGARVASADPLSFVVLGAATAGESEWDLRELAITDPLWPGGRHAVARDRDHLWWGPHAATVPATAVVIPHGYALTGDTVFHAGRVIEADAASFVAIGGGYARDAHRTFFHGHVTR